MEKNNEEIREDVSLNQIANKEQKSENELYEVPASMDNPVPMWLKLTYLVLPIWGIISGYIYINGTSGWLDRGYWRQLQIAANTTFPQVNEYREQDQREQQAIAAPKKDSESTTR